MVNGAGLAMATMDIIKLHGGRPATFSTWAAVPPPSGSRRLSTDVPPVIRIKISMIQ
jgi:hypothetical protein